MPSQPEDERAATWQVSLLDEGGRPTVSHALGTRPLYLGRSPANDLVLGHHEVSARHAALWVAQGRVMVEDLGSRNGTFVGERRVRGVGPWPATETLRLGAAVKLALTALDTSKLARLVLALEDTTSGLRVPLRGDRLVVGGGANATLRIEGAPEVVFCVDPDGEVWLGDTDGELRHVPRGEEVHVGPRSFRVVTPTNIVAVTADPGDPMRPYPYVLAATLSGPTGPQAELRHLTGSQICKWSTPNRVSALWMLARKLAQDRAAGCAAEAEGWLDIQEVVVGVWGRSAEPRNLGVLLTRIRADARDAGFDPWFLERRTGHLRARVESVEVES